MHLVPACLPVLVVRDACLRVSSNVLEQDRRKVLTLHPNIPTDFDHQGETTSDIKADEPPALTLTHKHGLESGLFRVQHRPLPTNNGNYAIKLFHSNEGQQG